MSKKEEPPWRAPLVQWWTEMRVALIDCLMQHPGAVSTDQLFGSGPRLNPRQLVGSGPFLDPEPLGGIISHLGMLLPQSIVPHLPQYPPGYEQSPPQLTEQQISQHQAIERMMRQLFGEKGPRVLSAEARRTRGCPAPSDRQPLLAKLALDADLRPLPATPRSENERAIIDRLSATERQRLCAAGYLLLVAALAFEGVGAVRKDRKSAEAVAKELLDATVWLYGEPCFKPVISLVEVLTGIKFRISSVKSWARKLQAQKP
jgi:hypothetical protein